MNAKNDINDPTFLLSCIEQQQAALEMMRQQLERYAEDFRYLLAADDLQHAPDQPPVPRNQVHDMSDEFIDAVSTLCHRLAHQLGQDESYCRNLAAAAQTILTIQNGARALPGEQVSTLAIEILLYRSKWFNGSGMPLCIEGDRIPLASRIFNLAEYSVALSPGRHVDGNRQHESFEAINRIRGKIFDPTVIDALLRLDDR
jgi:hypothetical protein